MPWINGRYIPDQYYNASDPEGGWYDYQQGKQKQRGYNVTPPYGYRSPAIDIRQAYKQYMGDIYGPEGTGGYVKKQVQGVSDVISPYLQALSKTGAANLAARGGLAGGAQDVALGGITGQKTQALGRATTTAQQDVAQNVAQIGQLAQNYGFGLSQADIQRFMAELRKRALEHQINIDWEQLKQSMPGFWDYFSDVIGAGAGAAGAYYGGR